MEKIPGPFPNDSLAPLTPLLKKESYTEAQL
jgi:hypothetical protein